MANLIEIPYDDGTTQTNVIINADAVFDIERSYDGAGTTLTVGLERLGTYQDGDAYIKSISLIFGTVGHSDDDIPLSDVQALKAAMLKNTQSPGNIASWHPANYILDPAKYSITSYTSGNTLASDF